MSVATWHASNDPQVYLRVEVEMTAAMAYARRQSEATGVRVNPVHLVVRAVGAAMGAHPRANALLRFGRVYLREHVDIACQVALDGPKPDLTAVVVRDVDRKTAVDIARELSEKARAARDGTDVEVARTKRTMDLLPGFLYRPVLWLVAFLTYTLNLDLRWLGLPRDPFGGAMVTSIGGLGFDEALGPLVPMTRAPVLVAAGRVSERPLVVDGQVVARPMITLGVTVDHRIIDGLEGGRVLATAREYLADPDAFEARAATAAAPGA
jgi:pyruvate dehydrogenase E2 component (dihydrolipoamide acetyltransferase)